MITEPIIANKDLVSFCGLYCGACFKYKNGKCPGCAGNEKASWCKIRSCCIGLGIASCADCPNFENILDCKYFNNFIGRLFALVFRSDRLAGITMIKENGYESFAKHMATNNLVAIKKQKKS